MDIWFSIIDAEKRANGKTAEERNIYINICMKWVYELRCMGLSMNFANQIAGMIWHSFQICKRGIRNFTENIDRIDSNLDINAEESSVSLWYYYAFKMRRKESVGIIDDSKRNDCVMIYFACNVHNYQEKQYTLKRTVGLVGN